MNLWNGKTRFMEARTSTGHWAGEKIGWTEGDHWRTRSAFWSVTSAYSQEKLMRDSMMCLHLVVEWI